MDPFIFNEFYQWNFERTLDGGFNPAVSWQKGGLWRGRGGRRLFNEGSVSNDLKKNGRCPYFPFSPIFP